MRPGLGLGNGICIGPFYKKPGGTPSQPANVSSISSISIDPGGTYALADGLVNGPTFDIWVWAYTNAVGYKLVSPYAIHAQADASGDLALPYNGKLSATWPAVSGASGYLVQVALVNGRPTPGNSLVSLGFWDNGNSTTFDDHVGLAYSVNSPIPFYPLSLTQGNYLAVTFNTGVIGTWATGNTVRYHYWTYSDVPTIGRVYSSVNRTASPDVNLTIVNGAANNSARVILYDPTEGADGIVLFRNFNNAGFIEKKEIPFTSITANGSPGTLVKISFGNLSQVLITDNSTSTGWGAGTEPPT
jgi:hypothetical protein